MSGKTTGTERDPPVTRGTAGEMAVSQTKVSNSNGISLQDFAYIKPIAAARPSHTSRISKWGEQDNTIGSQVRTQLHPEGC